MREKLANYMDDTEIWTLEENDIVGVLPYFKFDLEIPVRSCVGSSKCHL